MPKPLILFRLSNVKHRQPWYINNPCSVCNGCVACCVLLGSQLLFREIYCLLNMHWLYYFFIFVLLRENVTSFHARQCYDSYYTSHFQFDPWVTPNTLELENIWFHYFEINMPLVGQTYNYKVSRRSIREHVAQYILTYFNFITMGHPQDLLLVSMSTTCDVYTIS